MLSFDLSVFFYWLVEFAVCGYGCTKVVDSVAGGREGRGIGRY